MADIEKVMEGLRRCSCNVPDACSDCPYDSLPPRICVAHLTKDALELLKEQEPVTWSDDDRYDYSKCSNCGLHVKYEVSYMMNKPISFCPACGRRIKWDD